MFLSDVDELEKSCPLTISIHCSRGEWTEASRIPRGDLTAHRHIVRYSNINKDKAYPKSQSEKKNGDWQGGGLFIIWSPQPRYCTTWNLQLSLWAAAMNDRDDGSCVYGLRQQVWFRYVSRAVQSNSYWPAGSQARCLAGVHNESDSSQFLVGTTGPKQDNHLHLLDFDDSTFTMQSSLYRHPHEIWDIATCPFNEHHFFTTYSNDGKLQLRSLLRSILTATFDASFIDGSLGSSLWQKDPADHLEQTVSSRSDTSKDLKLLTTIPTTGMHK